GSLFILEAESVEEVERLALSDPYRTKGIFVSHEIHPFKAVLPSEVFGGA
ncbi:hypothetical protein HZA57_09545, partial [Candidatus Poribacteria bacterium]|nr:hypothetical protein [Candidatus Poribacteria bacterium]